VATISKEIVVDATIEQVWDAIQDVGALHTRLVPGFVLDTRLEPGVRTVTFANGRVVRERIVTIDSKNRRLVWSATSEQLPHHNGSAQAFETADGRTRIVWTADLLPDSAAGAIEQMMEDGIAAMRTAFNESSTVR
jgi:carbon monoxide dehydrogenase subunit G